MSKIRPMKLKKMVDDLKYEVIYKSSDYETRMLKEGDVYRPGMQLMGYYSGAFDVNRILILGLMEKEYMEELTPEERAERYDRLFALKSPAVVLCHKKSIVEDLLEDMLEPAKKHDITIISTDHDTGFAMSEMIRHMHLNMAPSITRHGVLVEVYGIGMLILGDSGIGKSETAIELLKRGHRIVADDAVEIQAVDYNQLQGTAPELIRHYVELRGVGIIDVRQIFGVSAVKPRQNIHLVVKLEQWKEGTVYDRLGMNQQYTNILGIDVPSVTIPVRPGRNLAVILEVAAMNQRQKYMGINAAEEFTKQLNKHFEEQLGESMGDEIL